MVSIVALWVATIVFQSVLVQIQAERIKTLESTITAQEALIISITAEVERLKQNVEQSKAVSRGTTAHRISLADINVIAGVVQAEAKGEPVLGKKLVAKVIINRMRWNAMSAEEIVTKQNQFAPWEAPDKSSKDAVMAAMSDNRYDFLSGFHNPQSATNPEAKKHKVLITVGRHDFW